MFFVEKALTHRSANGIITLDGPLAEGLFILTGPIFIADLSEDQQPERALSMGSARCWLAWLMDSKKFTGVH